MNLIQYYLINADDLPVDSQTEGICLRQCLPMDLGTGSSDVYRLDETLSFIETCYTPTTSLAILSKMQLQQPQLVVTLALQGNSRFVDGQGSEVVFKEGHTTITAFTHSDGQRQYEADRSLRQIRLALNASWLDRYFGAQASQHLFGQKKLRIVAQRPVSPGTLCALRNLQSAQTTKPLKIVRHAQALSILASELSGLIHQSGNSVGRVSDKDKVLAVTARDILFDEFRNPPSVEVLAQRVGTNPFKLKKLFHAIFDATPYGMLFEYRMKKAYLLLETTRCHVNVVADHIGYRHPGNFSAAFTRYFGVSPKKVAKR